MLKCLNNIVIIVRGSSRWLHHKHGDEFPGRNHQQEEQERRADQALPDQKLHVGVCQLPHREPDLRLPDQRCELVRKYLYFLIDLLFLVEFIYLGLAHRYDI